LKLSDELPAFFSLCFIKSIYQKRRLPYCFRFVLNLSEEKTALLF